MTDLICVVCALKPGAADSTFTWDETNPLADKHCPVCKSSATVAVAVFQRFAAVRASAKAKPQVPTAPAGAASAVSREAQLRSADVVARHIAEHEARTTSKTLNESHKWAGHVNALRRLLRASAVLADAESWWDGHHFYNVTSWSPETSLTIAAEHLDYVVIRLVNKDKSSRDVTFYINLDDEGMVEVGAVTK